MSELPDPVYVCRVTTITLFAYWSLRGWLRMGRFIRSFEMKAKEFSVSPREVRRQMRRVALCATIGDPTNALLLCAIAWLWTMPRF